MTIKRQLISIDEGTPAKKQHTKPCSDCPFARDSLRGWLGGESVEAWVRAAHGDERLDCHVHLGAQCAGAAIYRRNVAKLVKDPKVLALGADRVAVFDSPTQFQEHHGRGPRQKR